MVIRLLATNVPKLKPRESIHFRLIYTHTEIACVSEHGKRVLLYDGKKKTGRYVPFPSTNNYRALRHTESRIDTAGRHGNIHIFCSHEKTKVRHGDFAPDLRLVTFAACIDHLADLCVGTIG